MEQADFIKAIQNHDLAKRLRLSDLPKLTPEEQKEWQAELERCCINVLARFALYLATSLRSIYNEQNVLEHEFTDVEPTSDEFIVLAKRAKQIANDYCGNANYNVVLQGRAGTGKTMLGVCILNWVRKHAEEPKSCLFASVSEVADLAFAKYQKDYQREAKFNQFFKDLKETDLLLLDDLGTESSLREQTHEASNTIQQTMFRIGDLMQKKPIIITTNNTGDELTGIYNDKIVSRLLTSDPDHVLKFNNIADYRMAHN